MMNYKSKIKNQKNHTLKNVRKSKIKQKNLPPTAKIHTQEEEDAEGNLDRNDPHRHY